MSTGASLSRVEPVTLFPVRTAHWNAAQAASGSGDRTARSAGAFILIVDDDQGTRETFEPALRLAGFRVCTASSGGEGIGIARHGAFDLLLIDLLLPDMRGTDMIRRLRADVADSAFVLISGFLTTPITVEAMQLGALNVLEKPIWIEDLPAIVHTALRQRSPRRMSPLGSDGAGPEHSIPFADDPLGVPRAGSAVERWVIHVIKGCRSPTDVKTLEHWASCAGVSYSSLRESCHLVGVRAFDARDLVRVLRAVILASMRACPPEVLLDVCDTRTLDRLLARAGLMSSPGEHQPSVEDFFLHQEFIPGDNAALRLLRTTLTGGVLPQ